MAHTIDRAAVIGTGVMGANLAAHLANAGITTYLLDIVPPKGSGIEGDPASRDYRDAFARGGLERALRAKPAAFYSKEKAGRITTGNIEDDLELLKGVDWVLEAVVEKLDIKKTLFDKIVPFLKPDALLSSNTSGLSITDMAASLPDEIKGRFLGTHFFNPPRYMHLLELIPHAATGDEVVAFFTQFGEEVLGKGAVVANDTPNFIANRIGAFSMAITVRTLVEDGYTIEEIDALTGRVIGRAKSATFRTADLVGIDIVKHTAQTVYDRATSDECREFFKLPGLIDRMVSDGYLGEKSGQGFYKKIKKNGKSEILTLDPGSFDYRERKRPSFPALELVRNMDTPAERIVAILKGKDRAAEFLWQNLSETLVYAANRLGEISDDIVAIDNAMRWGFGWELGPFELWDTLGVERVAERITKGGGSIPGAVARVLETESRRFYTEDDAHNRFFFIPSGEHKKLDPPEAEIDLAQLKAQNKVVKKNAGASLVDAGDGIAVLEFHSKMNAIGADTLQMVLAAVGEVEKNFDGLVVGNQGANFSVGANLMLLLLEAQEGNWEEIDMVVRTFQRATMALKYSKRPVVAAPFGMALGGGCEMALGAGHVCASAELYMGLVELGVGLVPAGGGCKEMVLRQLEGVPPVDGVDLFPFVRAAFETIGLAKVSTSAEEARGMRMLRQGDGVTLNPDRLLYYAKQMARGLAAAGYRPPDPATDIPVVGEPGIASIKTHLYLLQEGKYISEYDRYLGGELATVLCGGPVAAGTSVSEQYLLDLERQAFLRLCGQRKSLERMQHMLKTGKPLRN